MKHALLWMTYDNQPKRMGNGDGKVKLRQHYNLGIMKPEPLWMTYDNQPKRMDNKDGKVEHVT
jgi:hypothetical protein